MDTELAMSAARVAGSVALLVMILWGVSRLSPRLGLAPEIGRKAIHVSLGLYCLSFPWLFASPWEVTATCVLAVAVFAVARGRLRGQLGEALHAVERSSYGEVLFAVSVALLFWLKEGHYITVLERGQPALGPVLYVLPLAMLTLCDAASALVGSAYGRRTFRIERGRKSWEGVAVFVGTGWLLSMIVYLLLTDIGRGELILLAFITAVFGALLEAASWRGLDNLFIPLGLYFLLSSLGHLGVWGLSAVSALFLVALVVLLILTQRSHQSRHLVATFAVLFFLIAAFSGVDSLLTPVLAVGAYALCARRLQPTPPPHDPLNLIVVIVAIALTFFVVSHIARVNTIFAFNVAFACLAAGIVARFDAPLRTVIAAAVIAMAAMAIRIVVREGGRSDALVFFALGGACVIVVTSLAWRLRGRDFTTPWAYLGGACTVMGLMALPASP
jgi:phytol kinase